MGIKNRFTSADRNLVQAVIDKDLQKLELRLGNPDCSINGVSRALYLSASMGMPEFCDMIFYDGIKQAYLNGCLICAITRSDRGMFDLALDEGADLHHDNEMPLRVAVNTLNYNYSELLVSMKCDIEQAFPPETLRSLFLKANKELNASKILSMVSAIKQKNVEFSHNEAVIRPGFKLF
jgi:hypothetical protein